MFKIDYNNRAAVGRLSGGVGIFCNLLLFAGKFLVGSLSGSVSITADAMNNLSDATSSVVTFLGFKLAEQPPDEEHPYGHARFEYLSGLAVAVLIILIGFELAQDSWDRICHPGELDFSGVLVGVLIGSIAVKLWLMHFNTRLGRKIQSTTLLATAADSRNDVIATSVVLAASLIQYKTGLQIDGWMGLGVSVFILVSGWNLARETISPLLGETASPEMRELIVDYIKNQPQVLGYHDLMVHDYGPGQRFASLHVEMDCREDPLVCHERIDDMERECLRSHGIHLVIHYDPIVTDDPELNRVRDLVSRILTDIDHRLTTHDFRMVQGKRHVNLIFDIALPADLKSREKAIHQELDRALAQSEPKEYHTIITFDSAAFNPTDR